MITVIIFILVLAVLVLAHEFGHFIAARKSGMRVYEFGFGFPPRIVGFYRDPVSQKLVWVFGNKKEKEDVYPATVYSINLLPLGGFCKIKGENGELENEADSFGAQKVWKKIIVLVAGVTMNFLLAGVLLGLGFMIGLPADLSAGVPKNAKVISPAKVLVQNVDNDSPAKEAGVAFGDEIVSLGDEQIKSSAQMVEYVKTHNKEKINLVVKRSGEEKILVLTPRIIKVGESEPRLGVALADAGVISFPWYIAIYKGFVAAFWALINIFVAFYLLIKNLIIGQGLAFEVSGPVGIATIVGQSAKLGFNYLLQVTAMISLSLAAMNILPIPALDGGRVLFIIVGKIIRRPVPLKYEQLAHTIGFMLLMILIVVITWRDVVGLIK